MHFSSISQTVMPRLHDEAHMNQK